MQALSASLETVERVGDGEVQVHHLTIDSRVARPGSLFAALPGSDFDGHDYIDAAISNGASALLVERIGNYPVPALVVPDSRAALAPLSARFYDDPSHDLTMIGITGTDGKTSTSYLIRHVLQEAGIQTGLIGTIGISIGNGTEHRLPHQTTPESHLVQAYLREMVEAGSAAAVLEATSHGLHMHRLDGTRFTIAGVTNITHEHLEYHGTIDAYRAAKGILIERVAVEKGTVVLNADDDGARAMEVYAKGARVLWYSMEDDQADFMARNVVADGNGCRFDVSFEGTICSVDLPMLGEFNVSNALCAIGMAHAAGVDLENACRSLAYVRGVPGRMNSVDERQAFNVVVDYAHTPESLRKVLALLRRLHPEHRVIVVSGSAGERDPSKRPLQGEVMAELADVAFITSEDPRNEDPDAIIRDIAVGAESKGGVAGDTFFEITDRREAIRRAFELARVGDCVLLAGKGHETSMIWGFEHRPWNEEAVAREELRALAADR